MFEIECFKNKLFFINYNIRDIEFILNSNFSTKDKFTAYIDELEEHYSLQEIKEICENNGMLLEFIKVCKCIGKNYKDVLC